jgi:hypothetical protein
MEGMTKGMTEPQGRVIFETITEQLGISAAAFPALLQLRIINVLGGSLRHLQDFIKKGKVTWKEPFLQLDYEIIRPGGQTTFGIRTKVCPS